MTPTPPRFVIVGTPRSGTTLVQRLASELPGVRVPPETHFFSVFVPLIYAKERFPLDEAGIRRTVDQFLALDTSRGLKIETDTIVHMLGGMCTDTVQLFEAIVEALADSAEIIGEKTPGHVLWWRLLAERIEGLKFVCVVRDPRAVVASALHVPWGMENHALLAAKWAADQRQVLAMRATLGSDRCTVIRYEDVTADASTARDLLARFIGVRRLTTKAKSVTSGALYHPWETWKVRSTEAVTSEGIEAWQQVLSPRQIDEIIALCASQMAKFAYTDSSISRRKQWSTVLGLPPRTQVQLVSFAIGRRRRMRLVEQLIARQHDRRHAIG